MNENKCEDAKQATKQYKAVAETMQVTQIIGMPRQPQPSCQAHIGTA